MDSADKRKSISDFGVNGRHDPYEGGQWRRASSCVLPALMQLKGGLQRLQPFHIRNSFGDQHAFVHKCGNQPLPPCMSFGLRPHDV
jgi:hypothetical protein